MKRLILVAAIIMASITVFAQHEPGSLTIQPRIGFSAADFNNTKDTKARVGMVVGPEFEYTLSNHFSLALGINYSQQGAEQDKVDITYKMDYLNVPIVANFYLVKGLAVKAGIQPGYNIKAKMDAKSVVGDFDDAVKKFDLSVPVGLSYEFRNIVLDARYNFGLTKMFDMNKVDLNSKNLAFQLTLGYKFTLRNP
jgi:hypothetical protein